MKELSFEKQACDHWVPEKAVFLTNSLGIITCPKCCKSWGVSHKDFPAIRDIKLQAEKIAKAKAISDPTGGLGQAGHTNKQMVLTDAQTKLNDFMPLYEGEKTKYQDKFADAKKKLATALSIPLAKPKPAPLPYLDPTDYDGAAALASHQFVSNHLKKIEPVYKSATVSLSQQFIMRVGLLSNCNVNIQHFVTNGGLSTAYRLHCQKCNATLGLDGHNIIASGNAGLLNTKIEKFCVDHRHGGAATVTTSSAVVQGPTGRKYRTED